MSEATDVGGAVLSFLIANWYLNTLQILFDSTKNEVKITEWVKVAEKPPAFFDLLVVSDQDGLSATQGVSEALT